MMTDSVHFKLTHKGKTSRFALTRTDDPLRIEEMFESVCGRVATIVGLSADKIHLAWKDVNSASISPPSIPLDTASDLQRAIAFIMHFDALDEQAKNKPLCLHLVVTMASSEVETYRRCYLCPTRLDDSSSLFQCSYKSTHAFCIDCTKKSLWQQMTKRDIHCLSGKKCLIKGTIQSWSFTKEMLEETLGEEFEDFMQNRDAARTAFVMSLAAAVGERQRAEEATREAREDQREALVPSENNDDTNNGEEDKTMRLRMNAVPGTAIRETPKDSSEIAFDPLGVLASQVKKETKPAAVQDQQVADESLKTKSIETSSSTELKPEPVVNDPLGVNLLENNVNESRKTASSTTNYAPSPLNATKVAPRKTVAERMTPATSVAKKAENKYETKESRSEESPEAELREAMAEFLKTAAVDAARGVMQSEILTDAKSLLSGIKELFKPVSSEAFECVEAAEEDNDVQETASAVGKNRTEKKKSCGNKCGDCDELKEKVRGLEKELKEKKEEMQSEIDELKRSFMAMEARLA